VEQRSCSRPVQIGGSFRMLPYSIVHRFTQRSYPATRLKKTSQRRGQLGAVAHGHCVNYRHAPDLFVASRRQKGSAMLHPCCTVQFRCTRGVARLFSRSPRTNAMPQIAADAHTLSLPSSPCRLHVGSSAGSPPCALPATSCGAAAGLCLPSA